MTGYAFLAEAEKEYLDAIKFYEDQKVGLGVALIHEFERVIEFSVEKQLGNLYEKNDFNCRING